MIDEIDSVKNTTADASTSFHEDAMCYVVLAASKVYNVVRVER